MQAAAGAVVDFEVRVSIYPGEYTGEYMAYSNGAPRLVTNTYYPFGDLKISKQLENATAAAEGQMFTFTLLLTDSEGNDLTDKYSYAVYDGDGNIIQQGQAGNGSEFKMKGGWHAIVEDIPSHALYQVYEAAERGFTCTGRTDTSGEIRAGKVPEAVFTNTYASTGRVELVASKVLTGRDLVRNQFKYDVYEIVGEDEVLVRSASSKEDGSVTFSAFRFTEADDGAVRRFVIRERDDGQAGYTYDTNEYFAEIRASDNGDGTFSFTVTYSDGDGGVLEAGSVYVFADRFEMLPAEWDALSQEEKDALVSAHQAAGFDPDEEGAEPVQPVLRIRQPVVFHNEYHAEGEISLKAWKQLLGRDLAEGEFTFELLGEELDETGVNVVLGSAVNDASGTVSFPALEYDEEDAGKTFHYFVREVAGSDDTVEYDDSGYGYSVYVVDNGDGTLSFTQKSENVNKVIDSEESCKKYTNTIYIAWANISHGSFVRPWKYYDYASSNVLPLIEDDVDISAINNTENVRVNFVKAKNSIESIFHYESVSSGSRTSEDYYAVYVSSSNADYNTVNDFDTAECTIASGANAYYDDCQMWMYVEWYEYHPAVYHYEISDGAAGVPLFTNRLVPGNLSITKLTQWEEGLEPDEHQMFHFKVKLSNPDGTPYEDGTMEYDVEQVENIGEINGAS